MTKIKHDSTARNRSFAEKRVRQTIAGTIAPLPLNKDWLHETVQSCTPALIDHRSHRLPEWPTIILTPFRSAAGKAEFARK